MSSQCEAEKRLPPTQWNAKIILPHAFPGNKMSGCSMWLLARASPNWYGFEIPEKQSSCWLDFMSRIQCSDFGVDVCRFTGQRHTEWLYSITSPSAHSARAACSCFPHQMRSTSNSSWQFDFPHSKWSNQQSVCFQQCCCQRKNRSNRMVQHTCFLKFQTQVQSSH